MMTRGVYSTVMSTQKEATKVTEEQTYKISGGEGNGFTPLKPGQIVRNVSQQYNGGPDWLAVVEAGARYYSEEGMSFGVGAERGHVYWAKCRALTEAEQARVDEQLGAERQAKGVREGLLDIRRAVLCGEYVRGSEKPAGRVVADVLGRPHSGDTYIVDGRMLSLVEPILISGATGYDVHTIEATSEQIEQLERMTGQASEEGR